MEGGEPLAVEVGFERSEVCVFSTAVGRLYGFLNTKRKVLFVPHPPLTTSHPERSEGSILEIGTHARCLRCQTRPDH